jgi:hypothetical protein
MTKRMAREPKTVTEQISSNEAAAEARQKPVSVPYSAPVPAPAPAPARTTKIDAVISLLRREEGATLGELVEATGWLPHTTRAALTGLRKKGHTIEKTKRGDVTCYRIVEAA